jgi:N-acetyl-anhydromuramyl-L-alanine amidase AmpD
MSDQAKAQEFADNVYQTIQQGATNTTTDGQTMRMEAKDVAPKNKGGKRHGNNQTQTECPRELRCTFVPARFAQNNPADPTDYGNLDTANRPHDTKIKYIVIHDTEGSYQSAIDWFQDPRSYVAAHYVIRSSDGDVTQMVKNSDVGWHAGNWYMNMHSIGIEHEGYAEEGGQWYTEAMYQSSAKLVRYLAKKYDIPLDREHIVGHEQYHGLTPARAKLMHNDPGPFWDWEHYMKLVKGEKAVKADHGRTNAVTIAPRFATNKPETAQCVDGVCAPLPAQSANFVYLRTEPNNNAPLLTDAGLHPDGAPGTKDIDDWSAVATYGQRFAVADRQGDWTAIWFNGQKGWFYNPNNENRTAVANKARLVTPKAGKTSVPLYGRPVPEASAYKNGVPPLMPVPLQYNLLAGQRYVAYDYKAINDYFHVATFDRSSPGDGTVIVGNEKYIPVSYNHRQAFVKASDVDVTWQ